MSACAKERLDIILAAKTRELRRLRRRQQMCVPLEDDEEDMSPAALFLHLEQRIAFCRLQTVTWRERRDALEAQEESAAEFPDTLPSRIC